MGVAQSSVFWLQTPVFWAVIGMLMLGLELINRRLVYFLPGSLAAVTLAVLIALAPGATPFWPLIAMPGVGEAVAWLAMTAVTTPVFIKLRRSGRRRRRRSLHRASF